MHSMYRWYRVLSPHLPSPQSDTSHTKTSLAFVHNPKIIYKYPYCHCQTKLINFKLLHYYP